MIDIIFALIVVSKSPQFADQPMAVFQTRNQCLEEAEFVQKQGQNAFCVAINTPQSQLQTPKSNPI
jgi:hypothetical protein